ncbi:MAG: tRNA (adenosine(37)-N6)-dimethylallyltransferase MiaA [Bacteroidota bacterium]
MPAHSHTKPKVLVLVGPTCSGKTEVGLALAEALHGEIISADSRQVYRYMDIGTAKPALEQRQRVKHYFVDELLPDHDFNAGEFGARGREIIEDIARRGKAPMVVGGSGLYIRSLVDGFFEGPGADEEFREAMERHVRSGRLAYLLDELRRVDAETAATIDPTKPRRIVRALEVYHLTGQPISRLHREHRIEIHFTPVLFGLKWDRQELYMRINARCDQMIAAGLLSEVESLEAKAYTDRFNALNTVGYAEAFAYRRGEISYEEFVRLFKRNTRRYAKRQMTWFRADKRIQWVEMGEERTLRSVVNEIVSTLMLV